MNTLTNRFGQATSTDRGRGEPGGTAAPPRMTMSGDIESPAGSRRGERRTDHDRADTAMAARRGRVESPTEAPLIAHLRHQWDSRPLAALSSHIEMTHHVHHSVRTPQALDLLKAAAEHDPRNADALNELWSLLSLVERRRDAIVLTEECRVFPLVRELDAGERRLLAQSQAILDDLEHVRSLHEEVAALWSRIDRLRDSVPVHNAAMGPVGAGLEALTALGADLRLHTIKFTEILIPRVLRLMRGGEGDESEKSRRDASEAVRQDA